MAHPILYWPTQDKNSAYATAIMALCNHETTNIFDYSVKLKSYLLKFVKIKCLIATPIATCS